MTGGCQWPSQAMADMKKKLTNAKKLTQCQKIKLTQCQKITSFLEHLYLISA